jgi:hypothetical protein
MRLLRTETVGVSAGLRVSGIHFIPKKPRIWPRVVAFFVGALAVVAASAPLGGLDLRPARGETTVPLAAQLTRNDCGAGLGVPERWQNPGRLSHSGDVVHWEPADGSVPLSGTLDDRSSATMRSTLIVQMAAPDVASSACVMRRDDRLDLVLAPTSSSSAVVGDLTYTFSSLTDSTCSGELAARGGTYDRLPCEIHYALSASPEHIGAPR